MLFKLVIDVLFSFPLRYLFAIGHHTFIFSLGWPAPPVFSQHSQADLLAERATQGKTDRSCETLCAPGVQPVYLTIKPFATRTFDHISHPAGARGIQSRAHPCSLAATKGISVDFFSSADLYA